MAAPAVSALRARFPEFTAASHGDPVVTQALATAYSIVGRVSVECTLACAAHLLALDAERTGAADGGSGEIKSERLGPKWTEYAVQAADEHDVFFSTTTYGRLVLTLKRRSPAVVLGMFNA